MKSIRTQIISFILCIVVVLGLTMGTLGCVLNFSTATSVLEQNMTALARIAADQVAGEISIMRNHAVQAGMDARLSDSSTPVDEMKHIIDQYVADFGFSSGDLLKINGDSRFNGGSYYQSDYFKSAVKGTSFMSDPIIDGETGQAQLTIAAPIWKDGRLNSGIVGVVCFTPDPDFLNRLMDELQPSRNGYGYIINHHDVSVADVNRSLVGKESIFELVKTDPSLQALAALEQKMINGETGFGYHEYEGIRWVQSYAPIPDTDGWSLGVMSPQRDFLDNFFLSFYVTIGVMVLFMLLSVIAAIFYAQRLTKPLKSCVVRLTQLAEADLHTPVPSSHRRDEIGTLQNAMSLLAGKLRAVISDLTEVLGQLAARNLDVKSSIHYPGDLQPIQEAAEQITVALNSAMAEIGQVSHSVEAGAGQMSGGAQALSQGAAEQASSIEELSATIAELTGQVKTNAQDARNAQEQTMQAAVEVEECSIKMDHMISAMDNISRRSGEISKIIKTIEDISLQTNLLALNAAVEAARAGTAGKGFAVVAKEVRNLARQSSEAAQSTAALISETVAAVNEGTCIAGETSQSMAGVVSGARDVMGLIEKIAHASDEQAAAIEQVNLGVDQISGVVQTNSATAEESAAASEELSGQARLLKDLVSRFHLREPAQVEEPVLAQFRY